MTVHELACSLITNSFKLSFPFSYSASIKLLLMWLLFVDAVDVYNDDQMMMMQIIMTIIVTMIMPMFLVQAEF